jgi:membrane protein YdbS with pleckstrin-like domain
MLVGLIVVVVVVFFFVVIHPARATLALVVVVVPLLGALLFLFLFPFAVDARVYREGHDEDPDG